MPHATSLRACFPARALTLLTVAPLNVSLNAWRNVVLTISLDVCQALMGPSGAGKSTLMDILAMRKTVGTLSGQLMVNGQPAGKSYVCSTSYVPQVINWSGQSLCSRLKISRLLVLTPTTSCAFLYTCCCSYAGTVVICLET